MNILVISVIPHYLSIIPAIIYKHQYSLDYSIIILISVSISILWHLTGERHVVLTVLDYFLAGLWCLCDISLSRTQIQVVCLNIIVGASNLMIQRDSEYWKWHTLWHTVSTLKCIYVSYYIMSRRIETRPRVITLLPLQSVNPDTLKTPFRRMRA